MAVAREPGSGTRPRTRVGGGTPPPVSGAQGNRSLYELKQAALTVLPNDHLVCVVCVFIVPQANTNDLLTRTELLGGGTY